jgi:molybdopterin-containing oxidoreductase family iron-sulfur binding subunit
MTPEPWQTLEEHSGEEMVDADRARLSRRGFLQLAGAGAASVALSACVRPPAQKILPYSRLTPEIAPGVPQHFATSLTSRGFARGVLVTCWEGRPVKVEGNPDHPASLGAAGLYEQAALDLLYDPDRAREFRRQRPAAGPATWETFQRQAFELADAHQKEGGVRLRFLVEPTASPLLLDLRARLLQRFPRARFVSFDPLLSAHSALGARLAFGQPVDAHLDLSKARVIVCLAADPLDDSPLALRHSRAWAARRDPKAEMNRLYVCEPHFTPTGTVADHRLALRPSEIEPMAWALLAELAALPRGQRLSAIPVPAERLPPKPEHRRWARIVAADLASRPAQALVVAGPGLPPALHAIVQAMNWALGAFDATVRFTPPLLPDPESGPEALRSLADEMRSGAVDTLVVTAHDPAFTAPADTLFAEALSKVAHGLYRGLYEDETARACEWFLPAAHPFESWGDARSADGMASLVQPLIAPLFGGVTEAEVLASFLGESDLGAFALLRRFWQGREGPGAAIDARWEHWLSDGVIPGTEAQPVTVEPDLAAIAGAVRALPPAAARPVPFELSFASDRKTDAGRLANLPRVQELPEPITKLAWGSAALLSPASAQRLGVKDQDLLRLRRGGRSIDAPALVAPGHADGCVTLWLGQGRRSTALTVASTVGVDAFPLRTTDAFWSAGDLEVAKIPGRHELASTQGHFRLEGRPHAPSATLGELQGDPKRFEERRGELPTLFAPWPYPGHQWAMAVDLGRCTGCEACVLACVTENNIPAVGFEHVRNHRQMQWLRIDRYYVGPPAAPKTINQPMACQHCRYAPCEYVCPVNATVHSDEGLNEQVYNRCVGTRYCSNNCPYKVRRFNFLDWNHRLAEPAALAMNPDVTVRSRGVMEKCTYCVQRIERARIAARREGRDLKDGEVVSACAQACPTEAIVFGDLADPASRVRRLQEASLTTFALHELGTRPRTAYLARVENPNPELAPT